MLPDNRDLLGRRDIEPRGPVVLPIGSVEVFLDDLLPLRQSVTSSTSMPISADGWVLQTRTCSNWHSILCKNQTLQGRQTSNKNQ